MAGDGLTYTVTALNGLDQVASSYTGTVHFSSNDGIAVLPANATLINGVGTFNATLDTAGSETIVATDTANANSNGTSTVVVSPAAASHFAVSVSPSATAGVGFTASVVAEDPYGNTAASYNGTVHFTSSDSAAVLPADSTLTAGVGSFNVTFETSGNQTLTATDTVDSAVAGTSSPVAVHAAAATHFFVSAPASFVAGVPTTFNVTALDQYNNQATGYAGVVAISSSDGAALLPASASLVDGVGSFTITLGTAGLQSLTSTDSVNSSITGTQTGILVTAGSLNHFAFLVPATAVAGTSFTFTVTAEDAYDNTIATYAGPIHFSSSDGSAMLPANGTLTHGVGTFNATLIAAGYQTLTAADTGVSGVSSKSDPILVGANTATHLALVQDGASVAGNSFSFTVTAEDAYDNQVLTYTGPVQFASSDSLATLPANSSLTDGIGTFTATLDTAGPRA